MALSDQHAVTYDFEELQPVIGGVRMDIYITGTAELAHDPSYGTFYVKSITLPGSVKDMMARPSLFGGRPRKPVPFTMLRRADHDSSLEAHLFRLIEAAIYEDEKAIEAWNAEKAAAA